jgi:FKBP-type peptidyl-prolyl cis-trans isomerase
MENNNIMKKQLLAALVIGSAALAGGCNDKQAAGTDAAAPASQPAVTAKASLSSEAQQVSYGIGLNFAENIKRQGVELDLDAFNAGVNDVMAGNEPQLAQADIMKAMQSFQQKLMEKQKAEREGEAQANQNEAEAFFAENGKKEGVVTLESGLQYKVITMGDGEKPGPDHNVEVNYRGTLLNGEEFDSSYKRGKPVSFPVKGVIKGWTEALQLMPVGSKWELYIPADLAYGPGGTGPIGPNAALVFEVELLSMKAPESNEG